MHAESVALSEEVTDNTLRQGIPYCNFHISCGKDSYKVPMSSYMTNKKSLKILKE